MFSLVAYSHAAIKPSRRVYIAGISIQNDIQTAVTKKKLSIYHVHFLQYVCKQDCYIQQLIYLQLKTLLKR